MNVLSQPARLAYGFSVIIGKACHRLVATGRMAGSIGGVAVDSRHRPDVVLVEFGFHAVRVMQAAALASVPFVAHFRGSDLSAQRRIGVLGGRYRRLVTIASGVVCKSRPMANTLEQLGMPPSRILISASGANPPSSRPEILHCSAGVSCCGPFVAKKGPLHTIRAFALSLGARCGWWVMGRCCRTLANW